MSLRFNKISNTSSLTPSIVEYSCDIPSMVTSVIAEPGIDDKSILRKALPRVWPKPLSSGSKVILDILFSASST